MKTIKIAFLLSLPVLFFFIGCQKDYPAIAPANLTDTVYIHDTIRIATDTIRIHDTVAPVPLTRIQMLTQKIWRMDFTNEITGGLYSQYYLGGANSTGINYDLMRFKFNADGTGTNTAPDGFTYSMAWHFAAADQRSISVTVNGQTDLWQMVELSGNYLHGSSQIIISGDPNNVESFRLIQVP